VHGHMFAFSDGWYGEMRMNPGGDFGGSEITDA